MRNGTVARRRGHSVFSTAFLHAKHRRPAKFLHMAQQKEIISTINGLIETLKDGQEGFKQAAEAVKDPSLKSLFNEFSLQRSKFAGELQSQVINLGEPDPEKDSSTSGALHRAWINIKSAITSGDDHGSPFPQPNSPLPRANRNDIAPIPELIAPFAVTAGRR